MCSFDPQPLVENSGLAFVGEPVTAAGTLTAKAAGQMLGARNSHGKPNADVLRQVVNAANLHRPGCMWQIDFPAGLTEAEAALFAQPFQRLRHSVGKDRDRWWVNPHADGRLRTALARRDRYLATPLGARTPEFTWIESSVVPDATILAVARDDDFTSGMLQSRLFAGWWRAVHPVRTPTLAVDSFPFPWPPSVTLNALTSTQEEHRHAVARAARGGDPEQVNSAVLAAYGWTAGLDAGELLAHLQELNRRRATIT